MEKPFVIQQPEEDSAINDTVQYDWYVTKVVSYFTGLDTEGRKKRHQKKKEEKRTITPDESERHYI